MCELLINHAKSNVWQEPNQDYQYNIGLGRLTTSGGFVGEFQHMWCTILSPTRQAHPRRFHHLYQIGQVSDFTLNLMNQLEVDYWKSAEDIVNEWNVLIQVYLETGAMVPLSHIWIMRNYTNNLLVCIHHDRGIDYGNTLIEDTYSKTYTERNITLDNDRAVIRFYSNAIQNNLVFNAQSSNPTDNVDVLYAKINNRSDFNQFMIKLDAVKRKHSNKGNILTYIDGFLHFDKIAFTDALVGKTLTYIYDESMIEVYTTLLDKCPVFKSKLDLNRTKYLFLFDKDYDVIDHVDDIDFYLYNEVTKKGVMINRIHPHHLRQVTHNAYSIDTALVDYYMKAHRWDMDRDNIKFIAYLRKGGMQKPVFSQANRADELFRLSKDQILNAFIDTDSLVTEWRATELENSNYTKLMSSQSHDLTCELVTNAYGYSGITTSLCNPLIEVTNNSYSLPDSFTTPTKTTGAPRITVYYYDADGLLLKSEEISNARSEMIIYSRDLVDRVKYVEVFKMGLAQVTDWGGIWTDTDVSGYGLEEFGYSCYLASVNDDGTRGAWDNVTDSDYVKFTKGSKVTEPKLTWNQTLLARGTFKTAVRVHSLIFENVTSFLRGGDRTECIRYTLSQRTRNGNNYVVDKSPPPPAVIEVFVGETATSPKQQLIEGVDFYVNYPEIVIVNAQVNAMANPVVMTRSYGGCDPRTNKPFKPSEVGFVVQGVLSVDGKYTVSRNRANKLVVNNRLTDKNKYKISEYKDGVVYPTDGRPYAFYDYIVPIEYLSSGNTTKMYIEMDERDRRIGDYLGQFIQDDPSPNPRAITERWLVVSPLIAQLLWEMKSGRLQVIDNIPTLDINDIKEIVSRYEHLLHSDPAYLQSDPNYTHVIPHHLDREVEVTLKQYDFLENVISLYLNNRVDLTNFVAIRS